MNDYDLNGKNKLTEMNVLQHEMNDLNINDNVHNENENNQTENDLNEVKEVLNCNFCNKHVYPIVEKYTPIKTSDFNLDNLAKGPYIKASWIEYLEDCGNKSQFRNKFYSIHNFKEKYYGNTIIWRGRFHHIKEGFFNSNSLFIRMNPSEYRYDKPDIRALFNNSLISQIENLQKNDFIEFECTLLEISKNRSSHLCLLWNVILLEKFEPKDFNVVDFIKHLSILDMISNNTNSNPFFINLDDKNNNARRSIKIVHFSNNAYKNPNSIHDTDQHMFNLLNNEMNNLNSDNSYIDQINKNPSFTNKNTDDEDEYDEDDMYEDNSDSNNFNHNEFFDNPDYEKAYNFEREFKKEKDDNSNYEEDNEKIYHKKKINIDMNEKINEKIVEDINENLKEKNEETNDEMNIRLKKEKNEEMDEQH